MRLFSFLLSLVSLSLSLAASEIDTVQGTVSANKLNVRISPVPTATVVATLDKGAIVRILRRQGDWFEIYAPPSSSVWAASSLLKDGVTVKELKLRAGPSVAESAYKSIPAGVKLQVLDAGSKNQAWTKIAPPQDLSAWVNSSFVSLTPEDAAKLPAEKEAESVSGAEPAKDSSSVPPASAALAAPPAEEALNSGKNDGATLLPFIEDDVKTVSMEGIILPISSDAIYVTHALAVTVKDEYFPICYLHSSKLNLKLWVKRKVQLKGQQRWVKGWKRPVIEVDHITPVWQ